MSLKGLNETFKKMDFINKKIAQYESELNKYRKSKLFEVDSDIIELYYDKVNNPTETGLNEFKKFFNISMNEEEFSDDREVFNETSNETSNENLYNIKQTKKENELKFKELLKKFDNDNKKFIKTKEDNITSFKNILKGKTETEIIIKKYALDIYTKFIDINYHIKLINSLLQNPSLYNLEYIQNAINDINDVMQSATSGSIQGATQNIEGATQNIEGAIQYIQKIKDVLTYAIEGIIGIQKIQDAMQEGIQSGMEGMDEMLRAMKGMLRAMEGMQRDMEGMQRDMEGIQKDMEGMQKDMDKMQKDMDKMQRGDIQGTMQSIQETMPGIRDYMQRIQGHMQYIQGHMQGTMSNTINIIDTNQKIFSNFLIILIDYIDNLNKIKKEKEIDLQKEKEDYKNAIIKLLKIENRLLEFNKDLDIKKIQGNVEEDTKKIFHKIITTKDTIDEQISQYKEKINKYESQYNFLNINIKTLEDFFKKLTTKINIITINDGSKYENLVIFIKDISKTQSSIKNDNISRIQEHKTTASSKIEEKLKDYIIKNIIKNINIINKFLKNSYTDKKIGETKLLNLFTINDKLGFRKLIFEVLTKEDINDINKSDIPSSQDGGYVGGYVDAEVVGDNSSIVEEFITHEQNLQKITNTLNPLFL